VSRRLAAVCGLLLAFLLQPAQAQEGRKFAVLSLIGDRITIVNHVGETSSRVDRNRREVVEMPPRVLDGVVSASIEREVRQASPGVDVVMLAGNPTLYAAQGDAVEDPDAAPVVAMVKPALAGSGVTDLILVTKLRHEASLRMRSGYMGSGKLAGIGFYLDHAMRTQRTDTGASGQGMLAPFAYFRVWRIDLARGEPLAHRDVLASTTVSQARSPSLMVWEALGAEQKVSIINALTQREAADAVREMLGKP
jgi:hypothetical protein